MVEDEDLKRLRQRKMNDLLEQTKNQAPLQKPIVVTDTTFKDTIQTQSIVVIDCWAPWCGPCHMIAPIIEELAKDYAGKVLFGKLNVDENRMVTTQYGIMSIPTLLVFKNGKLVDQIIGAMPRKMLEPRITRYLDN